MTINYRDFSEITPNTLPGESQAASVFAAQAWIAGMGNIRVLNVETLGRDGEKGIRVWYQNAPDNSTVTGGA